MTSLTADPADLFNPDIFLSLDAFIADAKRRLRLRIARLRARARAARAAARAADAVCDSPRPRETTVMAAAAPSLSPDPDVLVVGAGPVGMTAAAELARHGARVRLVDNRPGPVDHTQALAVHARMQEILGAMGIADGWLAGGHPLETLSIRVFDRRIGSVHLRGVDSPFPGPLIIGQNVTERLLAAHLDRLGVRIERPVEAAAFAQDAGGVTVRLRHLADGGREETVRAPWLVDCEGSASRAREAAGIAFDGDCYSGIEFVQADARVHWTFPGGGAYAFVGRERTVLFLPYDAHGRYRVLCARPETASGHRDPPTLAEMQSLAAEATGDDDLRLTDPTWLNRFRCQRRLARRFREGRIFLAGDAGHVHVPIGGQGMNYGVADAFNLAWKLAAVVRGDARPEPLLDSYHAERYPVDAELVHGTDEAFHALIQPGWLQGLAMRLAAPVAIGLDAVQEKLRRVASGIDTSYRGSPLTGDGAGERAPDAIVVQLPGRRAVRLFDLLYPAGRWTLLLFGGLEPDEDACYRLARVAHAVMADFAPLVNTHFVLTDLEIARSIEGGSVLLDREHAAHERYGAKTARAFLVRPDGHVGFRGDADARGELITYLYRIGLLKRDV